MREDAWLIGRSGIGKSDVATAIALGAVSSGCRVLHREAHQLNEDICEAREPGAIRKRAVGQCSRFAQAQMLLENPPACAGASCATVMPQSRDLASNTNEVTAGYVSRRRPVTLREVTVQIVRAVRQHREEH